jgi:predicted amidohydrolase
MNLTRPMLTVGIRPRDPSRTRGGYRAGIGDMLCRSRRRSNVITNCASTIKRAHILGFHSKTLPTGTMSENPIGEINHYAIRPLQTYDFHGVTLGGLICNDLWANPVCTPQDDPHLTHILKGRGAQVILHAVNGGRSRAEWSNVNWDYHSANLRMRARASKVWIATVDSSEPVDIRCSAPSGIIDPDGTWQCRTQDTGIDRYVYTIEM